MDKILIDNLNYILSYVSPRIQDSIKKLNTETIKRIQEIRIRLERPVVIVTDSGCTFLTANGKTSSIISTNCIFSQEFEITETINKMCGYSMHSHYEDLLNGYVTLPNGSRVGITGTAVYDKEIVKGIRNIDGINIRIPRNISGVSENIFNKIFKFGLSNLLIAGPPSSGKTTILKDLILNLSSGKNGCFYKVCVVDERKEISSSVTNFNRIGPNTDVLLGFPKSKGISMAVRTLSPDIIICDEISLNEIDEILNAVNCGVSFVFTIHAKNYDELIKNKMYRKILDSSCIDYVAFLKSSYEPGTIKSIIKVNEDSDENSIDYIYRCNKLISCDKLYQAM